MTHYAVSAHPCGGIQFAGVDENGKGFSLHLSETGWFDAVIKSAVAFPFGYMRRASEAMCAAERECANHPVKETRDEFDATECMRPKEVT